MMSGVLSRPLFQIVTIDKLYITDAASTSGKINAAIYNGNSG
jgi:hypothetical protein